MSYRNRPKQCHYCNEEFTSSRISARYCSSSCRSMDNRRKKNPAIYRHYNPVHLEYTDEAYRVLATKAEEQNLQNPKEYLEWFAEELITKDISNIYLNQEEKNVMTFVLNTLYPDLEYQVALLEWIKTRGEEDAIGIKRGKIKKK